jgi:hypothetical protein
LGSGRAKDRKKGEMDVSNWVILSIRLGYKFVLLLCVSKDVNETQSSGLPTTLSAQFGDATLV